MLNNEPIASSKGRLERYRQRAYEVLITSRSSSYGMALGVAHIQSALVAKLPDIYPLDMVTLGSRPNTDRRKKPDDVAQQEPVHGPRPQLLIPGSLQAPLRHLVQQRLN
jgi:hypothetical protein